MFTLIKKMFLTVIIAVVTVSANAQTDTTRAQGYFDFYTAVLADTSLPMVYYATGDVLAQNRGTTAPSNRPPFPTVFRVLKTATSFTATATGRTRFIENTEAVVALLDQHLDGKVTDSEKTITRLIFEAFRNNAAPDNLAGFTAPDIQTRITNALAAGAVDPSVQAALATAQAEVIRLTTALGDANAEIAMLKAEIVMLEEQIRAGGGTPVTADGGGGGGSGAGAAVVVAAVGGALYWWKIRNPATTFTFAAMPIDTDAYTAQLNFAPRENWHINVEYTESNLFASHDFVKPETNATAKMTVKYTW